MPKDTDALLPLDPFPLSAADLRCFPHSALFNPDLIRQGESLLALEKLGGPAGLSEKLDSSLKFGISGDSEVDRREKA